MSTPSADGIEMRATGIPGFDLISMGGLPRRRTTLVAGTAGSGKTIFATQLLVEAVRQAGDSCVFVTLEEPPDDIRVEMHALGWDIAGFEAERKWAFVDGSGIAVGDEALIGDYDLGGLLARIQAAVTRVGAQHVVIDAITVLFARFRDHAKIRAELFRISRAARAMGVTLVMTGERVAEYGEVGRYGIEEFVADNVVILRNVLDCEMRRRTIEILKLRGAPHRRGEFPFVITSSGIEIIPLSAIALEHPSTSARTTFGNAELDRMGDGGLFGGSTTVVSGPTGVGKTLVATEFAAGGIESGDRCLFLGFEESREQLFRNATAWGYDLARFEAEGKLRVVCEYPEAASLEDRLLRIKELVREFRPERLVLDTLTVLYRLASDKRIRDFSIGLVAFVKREQITALFTADIGPIFGAAQVTDQHLSSISDSIILLRYVEIGSQIHRGVAVLKMRGSRHDTRIREFTVDGQGMHVGPPFLQAGGILTGSGVAGGTAIGPGASAGKATRRK